MKNINRDLIKICNWSKEYGMSVNQTKTHVIIVGSLGIRCRLNFLQIPDIVCSGSIVSFSEKVKNWGYM